MSQLGLHTTVTRVTRTNKAAALKPNAKIVASSKKLEVSSRRPCLSFKIPM